MYRVEIESWFAAVPELAERLADGSARVLDIGCGAGWSSVSIAHAYPGVTVDGLDLNPGSIEAAQRVAVAEGVTDRVRFEVRDAATLSGAGYDVTTMFEMLHDLARPVEALRIAREALGPGGVVLVADELVGDGYAGPADESERRHYGWSLLHCLPASMTEPGSAVTGTLMRPDTVRAVRARGRLRHGRGAAGRERRVPTVSAATVTARMLRHTAANAPRRTRVGRRRTARRRGRDSDGAGGHHLPTPDATLLDAVGGPDSPGPKVVDNPARSHGGVITCAADGHDGRNAPRTTTSIDDDRGGRVEPRKEVG